MNKITIEMPIVSKCEVDHCGYNLNQICHAKAITIGDNSNPGCDTFFLTEGHSKETKRHAGVGACKVNLCQYNKDFECNASTINVGFTQNKINCLTFEFEKI